jgi:hypothetical protein
MYDAHLRHELAHVLGARARRCLIGHRADPLDKAGAEQPGHRHEHEAHRAIAADEIQDTGLERLVDHIAVHRVEHDHGVVFHAQRRRGVDPVAVPAGRPQSRMHVGRVIAALTRNQDVGIHERRQIAGVLHWRYRFPDRRRRGASLCR